MKRFLCFVVCIALCIVSSSCSASESAHGNSSDTTAAHYGYYEPPTLIPPPTFDFDDLPTFETLPPFSFDDFEPTFDTESPTEKTSIDFIRYPETAHRNEKVTVKIQGEPYTTYSITVTYSSGPSTAAGLRSKESDASGYVSWTWKVGGRTSFGTYPITVTGGGSSDTVYFDVS